MNTIDIIIPCWKSNDIIDQALKSINIQTIKNNITVILVNDSSLNTKDNYQSLIKKYKDLKIKYFKTSANQEQRLARQLGLDNATSKWVMFLDDDDQLINSHCLELIFDKYNNDLDKENIVAISTPVTSMFNDNQINLNYKKYILHGKIFKLQFLKDNNICFPSILSFLMEGMAFLTLLNSILSTSNNYLMVSYPITIYQQNNNKLSINNQFSNIDWLIANITYRVWENITILKNPNQILTEDLIIVMPILVYILQNTNYSLSSIQQQQIIYCFTIYQNVLLQHHNIKDFNFIQNNTTQYLSKMIQKQLKIELPFLTNDWFILQIHNLSIYLSELIIQLEGTN